MDGQVVLSSKSLKKWFDVAAGLDAPSLRELSADLPRVLDAVNVGDSYG